jgi:flagellar biosynthesis protein FlhG
MLKDMPDGKKCVKTIAVASGKGGVGKTNIASSLAIAMRRLGKNVVIVDADLGLSNITILLNKQAKYTIKHLLEGTVALKDILIDGQEGIKILPAGDGMQDLTHLDEFQRLRLLEAFDSYTDTIDVLLIDISAGISENVTFFCSAAQELIIVTTPEPTAWVDAYHLIKVLYTEYQENKFHVLVNAVKSEAEAREVFATLTNATDRFLSIGLNYLGYLPYDEDVKQAVRAQRAFIDLFPRKFISKCVAEIAVRLLDQPDRVRGTLQFFIGNLLSASIAAERGNSPCVKQTVER